MPRFVSMTIPQVRRGDGGDGIHAVPQDSGNFGSIWLLVLDAVLLLHRSQTAVRDDWPVRPPDVQPDVFIFVSTIHFSPHFLWFSDGRGGKCRYNTRQFNKSVVDIAFHRSTAVTVGVVWAGFVSRFWWPSEARRELGKQLGEYDWRFSLFLCSPIFVCVLTGHIGFV
jgi:hypothetical protein